MIKGKKISLSLFKSEQEVKEFLELFMDIESRSILDHTKLNSIPESLERYRDTGFWTDNGGTMAIRDDHSSLIGSIFFKSKSITELIIGLRIFKKENRGRGYGSEALALFSEYLFMTKPIERITLEISSDNIPSIRMAESVGYTKEGVMRKAFFLRGKLTDTVIFGMLRSESGIK